MSSESLFRRRVPEAAARQLATVLASATEMHLATLESMQIRKSTPKSALKRQQDICDTLVEQCADLDIPDDIRGLRGRPCARLGELLRGRTELLRIRAAAIGRTQEAAQRAACGDRCESPRLCGKLGCAAVADAAGNRESAHGAAVGDTPLRNGQTEAELSAAEREHFGDPDERTGIYAARGQ